MRLQHAGTAGQNLAMDWGKEPHHQKQLLGVSQGLDKPSSRLSRLYLLRCPWNLRCPATLIPDHFKQLSSLG